MGLTTAADALQGLGVPAEVAVNPVSLVILGKTTELVEKWQILFRVLEGQYGMETEWNGTETQPVTPSEISQQP